MTRRIGGLAEIAGAFDAALVDQFGVLHDGEAAFPGARACLDTLARRDISMVALTNSGKRAAENAARLTRLGFPAALFRAVVSSGELAHRRIAEMLQSGALPQGARVAVIARGDPRGVMRGLPVRVVAPPSDADLLLIAGAEPETVSREAYRAALAPLALRKIPAICANPDMMMYSAIGPAFGAGAIARDYEAAGGDVVHVGKPAPAMFAAALARLAVPAGRVLMIGDSAEHDIAGAARAGCLTLQITGGVQAAAEKSPAPDFSMPRLAWRSAGT